MSSARETEATSGKVRDDATTIDFAFPIRGLAAHPDRVASAEAAAKLQAIYGIPVRIDPTMPKDEIHIISDGRLIVFKLKPIEDTPPPSS